jgi:hypothetical protein
MSEKNVKIFSNKKRVNQSIPFSVQFGKKGIPFIFVTRGLSPPDFHLPTDDAERINYKRVSISAKLIFALLQQAGNNKTLLDRFGAIPECH